MLLSNIKFGIEFEFSEKYIGMNEIDNLLHPISNLYHNYKNKNRWVLYEDCSCGPEITTPAFSFNQNNLIKLNNHISQWKEVFKELNKTKLFNNKTGMHIHLSFDIDEKMNLDKFFNFFMKNENVIFDIWPSRKKSRYLSSLKKNNNIYDHYKAVHLICYSKKNENYHFEFRYPYPSLKIEEILTWLTMFICLSYQANEKKLLYLNKKKDIFKVINKFIKKYEKWLVPYLPIIRDTILYYKKPIKNDLKENNNAIKYSEIFT